MLARRAGALWRGKVQAGVLLLIMGPWTAGACHASEMSGGGGFISGYQYGKSEEIAGVEVKEGFGATGMYYVGVGWLLSSTFGARLEMEGMRFVSTSWVDDGQGGILSGRRVAQIEVLELRAGGNGRGKKSGVFRPTLARPLGSLSGRKTCGERMPTYPGIPAMTWCPWSLSPWGFGGLWRGPASLK